MAFKATLDTDELKKKNMFFLPSTIAHDGIYHRCVVNQWEPFQTLVRE